MVFASHCEIQRTAMHLCALVPKNDAGAGGCSDFSPLEAKGLGVIILSRL